MKKNAQRRNRRQEESRQERLPIRELIRGELRDAVTRIGLRVIADELEEDRRSICGTRYEHDENRQATRGGSAPSELVFGGRRIAMRRPRVRSRDGHEIELPTWNTYSQEDPLDKRTVSQLLIGVATRKYARSLEALPEEVEERGISKSAVSRRFIRVTTAQMADWQKRDLSKLNLCVLMIDGIVIGQHTILVALGIDTKGIKHILGIEEGATENSVACKALLSDLETRGLRTDRPILGVLDGSKALSKAIRAVFGKRVAIQRCQVHKKRNVLAQLPKSLQRSVGNALGQAYRSTDEKRAKRLLMNLHRRLQMSHPGAAASLLEGMDETLTVLRLGLTGDLARILATTNAIENLMGLIRYQTRNVRRWKDGTMVQRWTIAALSEAAKGFRRLKGFRDLPKLIHTLNSTNNDPQLSIDDVKEAA